MKCTSCSHPLTAEAKQEGPGAPEIGWEYYKCPECESKLRPDAVEPESETVEAKTSQRHVVEGDDMPDNLSDEEIQVLTVIREQSNDDGNIEHKSVVNAGIDECGLREDLIEDIIHELMMQGLVYEPQDEWYAPI